MQYVGIGTAELLLGVSRRTIWRRLSEGRIRCDRSSIATRVALDDVVGDACISIAGDDVPVVVKADVGDAEGLCDLGMMFMAAERLDAAMSLLKQAAEQNYPEAMYWLARCHSKAGCPQYDEHMAIMWLSRAASLGHYIAGKQMDCIRAGADAKGGKSLDDTLEAIDRKETLLVLNQLPF